MVPERGSQNTLINIRDKIKWLFWDKNSKIIAPWVTLINLSFGIVRYGREDYWWWWWKGGRRGEGWGGEGWGGGMVLINGWKGRKQLVPRWAPDRPGGADTIWQQAWTHISPPTKCFRPRLQLKEDHKQRQIGGKEAANHNQRIISPGNNLNLKLDPNSRF